MTEAAERRPRVHQLRVEGRLMSLVDSSEGRATPRQDAAHTAYAIQRADQRRELGAFRRLISGLTAGSVLELFGGSGWHSAAIQELVKPETHVVFDLSRDCVASVQMSLPEVSAHRVDSFAYARDKLASRPFDWVHADFNQFTLLRHLDGKQYTGVLDGIFASAQKLATITDSAVYGIARFQRNRNAYRRAFGVVVEDLPHYFSLASRFYYDHWGYSIRRVITWDAMACTYVLAPGEPVDVTIIRQTKKAHVEYIQEITL